MSNIELEITIEGKKQDEPLTLELSKMIQNQIESQLKDVICHFCKFSEMNGYKIPDSIISEYLTDIF